MGFFQKTQATRATLAIDTIVARVVFLRRQVGEERED
jgi:hypothetical protein